jgi:F-type H+-transporting ATPase subunit b
MLSAPQSHEPLLIDLDATVFIQLGIFLLLVAVLHRLLWKPYLKVRAERTSRVDGYREEATRLDAEAEARLANAEAQLAEARRIGVGERAVARAEAQAREKTLLAEAQAEAQKVLADARKQLDASLTGERAQMQSKAREIGREAARKILGREVSA